MVDEQVVCIAKNGENIIQLENQVDYLLPKALYTDNVLNSVSCYTTTQIAKELGITAQELNRQLCALHIQYYQSGQYLNKTIEAFPQGEVMMEVFKKAGFAKAEFKRLTFGICTLYFATK